MCFLLPGQMNMAKKIVRSAEKINLTPLELVDKSGIKNLKISGPLLNIEYDDFIRTTEPRHIKVVQEIILNKII